MRRGDHTRFRIAEKQHAAIGSGDAEREAADVRDDAIAARALASPWLSHNERIGGMDLIGNEQTLKGSAKRGRHTSAVLAHILRIVARTGAAVQARIHAGRDTAVAREEGVADARM